MRFNSSIFQIDATPRRADGEYMAHARISCNRDGEARQDIYVSGDLAGFDMREDAIRFATDWAMEWLERRYG
ncbi:hypothetical protein [Paraburkholderia solisilvae]|uniref:Transcriptional activator HlyU n=1 Tax=Paraburkholderia solisilvae TaxID=624376 RepID=A0A6J5E002_9BURK|nr:hypothetical protein [Paraburkholderia solisilvae]CAB3759708.1 hypothetical protein LMG29739_03224 [Paraburkholderia solisilvae]